MHLISYIYINNVLLCHGLYNIRLCNKRLMLGGIRVGGEGDDRGWDGWMASWTRWMWVWVGDGQGDLACCNSWGRKELDTTDQLKWTELNWPDRQLPSETEESSSGDVFPNESTLHMRWPKYWSFSFSIIPSKKNPRADLLQNGLVGSPNWP